MPTVITNTIVPLLGEAAAADVLGLSAATLRCWRSLGKGPPYRKLGTRVVYDEAEIRSWTLDGARAGAALKRPVRQSRTVLA